MCKMVLTKLNSTNSMAHTIEITNDLNGMTIASKEMNSKFELIAHRSTGAGYSIKREN